MSSFFVGIDDGYNTTIAFTARGESLILPSRVRIGGSTAIQFKKDKSIMPVQYRTEGSAFSVNASVSDDITHDDYPFSGANRVMVQHALRAIRFRDEDDAVAICTGLPMRRYYKSTGANNTDVIERKIKSLQLPVTCIDDNKSVQISHNSVMPESLSAIFDLLITERRAPNEPTSSKPTVKENKDCLGKHIAFVDIGGRTTDVAIWAGGQVEKGNFGTLNAGMEDIYRDIRENITDEFSLPQVPDQVVFDAFKTGKVRISGEIHDVSSMIKDAIMVTSERIRNTLTGIIGSKAQLLEEVVFIGGGAEALYTHEHGLGEVFKNQRLSDDPILVNARSFYKYLRYVEHGG